MQYALVAISTLVLAGTALADHHESGNVHTVTAGPGTVFEPNTITAEEGDWISVSFPSGHDFVQSSFDAPCTPLENGISSGVPEDGTTFSFQYNATTPQWFYCSVARHCQSGMTLAINPTTERTIEAYTEAAAAVSAAERPSSQDPVGGNFEPLASESEDSASSSGSGTTSATSSGSSSSSTADSGVGSLRSNLGLVAGFVAAGAAFAL